MTVTKPVHIVHIDNYTLNLLDIIILIIINFFGIVYFCNKLRNVVIGWDFSLLNLQSIVPVQNNYVFEIFRHISLISSLCTYTYVLGQYEEFVSIVAANGLISIGPLNKMKELLKTKIYGKSCGIKTVYITLVLLPLNHAMPECTTLVMGTF